MAINTWISAAVVAALASALANADRAAPNPALSTAAGAESMAGTIGWAAVDPAPATTITIWGPNPILPNESCSWWVYVNGFQSPFHTYVWEGGTMIDQTPTSYVASSSGSFQLSVHVYLHGEFVGSAYKNVTVSSNTGGCMI
jgi:hypothetical protein